MTGPFTADLSTTVGSVALANPVMTASGTAGHGAELGAFFDLADLGAVVVKSLSVDPWPGNPPLRVHETAAGMINSVGLQGPGVAAWLSDDLPELMRARARVVVSIWGRDVDDYAAAAEALAVAPPAVIAVEVNLSCPNLADHSRMFAQSPDAARAVVSATRAAGRPRWAKLTPQVVDIVEIAEAAADGGAEAVVLTNTVPGLVIDTETRRPVLGAGPGGLSGPAIRPVAVRAVHAVRAALPHQPIVGAGGVASARDVVEFLLAGADAVQVGTATFADPRAPHSVLVELRRWCDARGVHVNELIGGAHV